MTPSGQDLAEKIAGVRSSDVDAVRAAFPRKFASVRPLLLSGRLGQFRELVGSLRTLFDLLVDPTFSAPWRTTAAAVFALGYFVLAIDAIPDVIPVLGFLDDALVVAEVIYLLSDDLRRFRQHRAMRQRANAAAEVEAAAGLDDMASSSDRAAYSERLVA